MPHYVGQYYLTQWAQNDAHNTMSRVAYNNATYGTMQISTIGTTCSKHNTQCTVHHNTQHIAHGKQHNPT
ncbi:MAG: hypothetical protein MJA30_29785, partial [Cytophagales bacterium]|nr:hypothetical protein [Cytophagales bacterium]